MARLKQAQNILRLIENNTYTFICNAIRHQYNTSPFELFPELVQFKPEDKGIYRGWWNDNEEGKQSRIVVLNKLIKILENGESTN